MASGRSVDRRQVLKTLGAYTVVPVFARLGPARLLLDRHPLVPGQAGQPWAPRFLTAHENETVTVMSELIIPATDTPGARAAKVNQHIDHVLGEDTAPARDAFRNGLAWIDRTSRERFGENFVDAETAQQTELLTALALPDSATSDDQAGVDFFRDVRSRTIAGYYSSEVGMLDELQFRGNTALREFTGCTHPEHLDGEPAADDSQPPNEERENRG